MPQFFSQNLSNNIQKKLFGYKIDEKITRKKQVLIRMNEREVDRSIAFQEKKERISN